ncbi:hypothetical protein [Streptomyces sp. NBC_01092]|uniref:hypothetical protein n=1 Tax=Streptomyces sp. NBC_01092 TaxID=2903748 RepID=UPI0038655254|nr:hypothetical protein OG254_38615 [Streptomyces sp. NBC_01092]
MLEFQRDMIWELRSSVIPEDNRRYEQARIASLGLQLRSSAAAKDDRHSWTALPSQCG